MEKPDEKNRIKKLKQENERLKKALADEHLKALLYESLLEVACEEFWVEDVAQSNPASYPSQRQKTVYMHNKIKKTQYLKLSTFSQDLT